MIAVTIFSCDNTRGFCLVYLFLSLLIFMVTGRPRRTSYKSSIFSEIDFSSCTIWKGCHGYHSQQ